jgi:exonuclease III
LHKNISVKNGLNILYMNINSLRRKLESFEQFLSEFPVEIHVIILVEINLTSGSEQFFNIEGFVGYFGLRKGKEYGGVAIYVNENLTSNLTKNEQCEFSNFLSVELVDYKFSIIGVYTPPDSNFRTFMDYFDSFLDSSVSALIFGDFNANLLNQSDQQVSEYMNTISANGYTVLNKISREMYTRRSNTIDTLIDHVLNDRIDRNFTLFTGEHTLSDHRYLLLNVEDLPSPDKPDKVCKRINYSNVTADLFDYDFENANFDDFYQYLRSLIDKYTVVFRSDCSDSKHKPWYSDELEPFLRLRDRFYVLKQRFITNDFYKTEFKKYRNLCVGKIRELKKKYYDTRLKDNMTNIKKLWSTLSEIMHNRAKKVARLKICVKDRGVIMNEPEDIVIIFNIFFVNVALHLDGNFPRMNMYTPFQSMLSDNLVRLHDFTPVNTGEIERYIDDLRPGTASGYDGINCKFIKAMKDRIAIVLSNSINEMFRNKRFPKSLKIARVTPIFKDGDKTDVTNYRPISVLPVLSKIYENSINSRLTDHLFRNELIHRNQFGFQKSSNTTAAMVNLFDGIIKSLERKKKTCCLFIDLKKAFDCVNHIILSRKLDNVNILGDAKELLVDYLNEREQYVEIDGVKSPLLTVKCGIPQGSILGPKMFLIYINDIFGIEFRGILQLFADDAVLTYSEDTVEELRESMLHDLHLLLEWMTKNRLTMNIDKTKFVVFSLGTSTAVEFNEISFRGQAINRVNSYKYLGLHIDSQLNFSVHIDHIVRKISPMIGVFRKINFYIRPETLLNVYFAYIHSHFNYLSCIWGTATNSRMNLLQRLQNKAIKYIFHLPRLHPTSQLYNLKILPVSALKEYDMLLVVFKIMHGMLKYNESIHLSSDVHAHSTRSASNIYMGTFRCTFGRKSIFYEGFKLFNDLPLRLKSIDGLANFSKEIRQVVLSRYFHETTS